jgi:hypothetical protein
MAESKEFRHWLRIQAGHSVVSDSEIQKEVDAMLAPENIRVEVRRNGVWVEEKN